MDVEQTIREYLNGVLHMSLATCVDNKPWVCEVHFVFDDDLNLYWRSKAERRHSQEIASNPHVAGTIVEQHTLSMKPRGLYFEGDAVVVEDLTKESPVYESFVKRLDADPDFIEEAKKPDGHHVYKINVSDWYLFDARDSNPAQKYQLER